MRSGRPERRTRVTARRVLAAAALGLVSHTFAAEGTPAAAEAPVAATSPAAASAPAPMSTTEQDVAAAVATVRRDPNLGGPHTERRLQFKPDEKKRKPEPTEPWILELLRWMAEAGRGVVWLIGAIAVALVIVLAWRWMRVRADAAAGRTAVQPPSHVNDLDIRPDSLPDDIAGTARAWWQRGEQRAALSLLYRGALSRLVHEHGVAISGASTEGECVQLARQALSAAGGTFFAQLVAAWQMAVYAGRWPDAASVASLCDGFDAHFAAPRRAAAPGGAAVAGAAA